MVFQNKTKLEAVKNPGEILQKEMLEVSDNKENSQTQIKIT